MKVIFLDKKTLGNDLDFSIFEKYGEVIYHEVTKPEETLSRVKDANIVVTNKVVIDKDTMDNSNIKLICVAATGMNNIDLDYAKQKGIEVKNVVGYSTESVAQLTLSFTLHFMNNLNHFDNYAKQEWQDSDIFTHFTPTFHDIQNKVWGIIGLGNIGKRVAQIASTLGAKVIYYSTSGANHDNNYQEISLEELLKTSDIISIHSPLNQNTKDLINSTNLPLLKDSVILLNLGRGGIINEIDLANHIDRSNIKVGLDVLGKEPIPKNHPLLNIKRKDALLMTPHLAWASFESRKKLLEGIYQNIGEFYEKVFS